MHMITDEKIMETLARLYKEASFDKFKLIVLLPKLFFGKFSPRDARNSHFAISRKQGEFIYDLLVNTNAKNIVEFGTSFGISTIYLAAAAQQTGGNVVTSELLAEKCIRAQQNFESAGVASVIELREGDALKTLASVNEKIDFVLLDGWNNLYLPVLKLLENKLATGAYIYSDNASFPGTQGYLDFLYSNSSIFENTRIKTPKGDAILTKYLGNS